MELNQFERLLLEQKLTLTARQQEQFERYYQLLIEWNKKINLTALTGREEVYLKHFYDSLSPAFYFNFEEISMVADIGSGAGFPGLPLKICFPHLKLTIIDALKKRILFLEHLVDHLNLKGVTLLHDRAEMAGHKPEHRQQYDLVMARAVAQLPVLAELCLPFAKVGGSFIAMKGSKGLAEVEQSKRALATLGGALEVVHRFELPEDAGQRQLIVIRKEKPTPKRYPRQPGLPAKKPLR